MYEFLVESSGIEWAISVVKRSPRDVVGSLGNTKIQMALRSTKIRWL